MVYDLHCVQVFLLPIALVVRSVPLWGFRVWGSTKWALSFGNIGNICKERTLVWVQFGVFRGFRGFFWHMFVYIVDSYGVMISLPTVSKMPVHSQKTNWQTASAHID